MKIKKDERYRFNEEVNEKKSRKIAQKSTAVSLKTKQDLDQINAEYSVEAYQDTIIPGVDVKEEFKTWWSETARPFYMAHRKEVEEAAKARVIAENENWWSLTCDFGEECRKEHKHKTKNKQPKQIRRTLKHKKQSKTKQNQQQK